MTKTALITGANRGIGLELVKRYLQEDDWHVIATCRQPANAIELKQLVESSSNRLTILALEVTDSASVLQLKNDVNGKMIDVLINNAGIYNDRGSHIGAFDFDKWAQSFDVNVLGPMRVTEALRDNLDHAKPAKIISISSQLGALSRRAESNYGYCSSKAALNKSMSTLANELEDTNMIVAIFHPGWVQTDMGGSEAEITPAQSADGIFTTTEKLTKADSGKFLKWNGEIHPW